MHSRSDGMGSTHRSDALSSIVAPFGSTWGGTRRPISHGPGGSAAVGVASASLATSGTFGTGGDTFGSSGSGSDAGGLPANVKAMLETNGARHVFSFMLDFGGMPVNRCRLLLSLVFGLAGELGNLARCLAYHRACTEAGLTFGSAEWAAQAVAVHGLQETLKCLLML